MIKNRPWWKNLNLYKHFHEFHDLTTLKKNNKMLVIAAMFSTKLLALLDLKKIFNLQIFD